MEGDRLIAVCSKLNRHVQMKVAERGMNNSDEEFWDVGSWFQRWGEACRKERWMTLSDDDGLMRVT